jgi:DNA invertase Pin-like site-specific DNA recombinase
MKTINFIQVTHEQLQETILQGVREGFKQFKKEFQQEEPDEILSRTEAAKMFKITVTTLDRWTNQGRLIRFGLGKKIFYKRSQLEAALVELKAIKTI